MLSSRIGRAAILATAVAAAAAATSRHARGDLDRIAADGVTELGGSPAYARMLPRTKADGTLDASLLPPVADWASQPISNLYYAAGNAKVQGNGSPQYPFTNLTYAAAHMAPQSALLLAPATYSGSVPVASGKTVALVGLGPAAYVSYLAVPASGSSADTCLALVGLNVGTLSVSGGRINIRLSGTTVARLEGTSSSVTVTRTDLGSSIGVSTLPHGDVYTGYDTVPKARALVDPGSADMLTVANGRAAVSGSGQTRAVAYLSDVEASTNGINTALQGLAAADAALASRVDAEMSARASGDAALSNRLDSAKAALEAQISTVGTSWGGQLSTLSTALSNLRVEVQALRTTESGDIASVNSALAAVQTAYASADAAIRSDLTTLQDTVGSLESGLSGRISDEADIAASNVVNNARAAIVADAVSAADAHIASARTALTGTISETRGELLTRISGVEERVITLENTLNYLIDALAVASNAGTGSLTNYYRIALPPRIQ